MQTSTNIAIGLQLSFRTNFVWLASGALVLLILAASLSAQFSGRQPATVALDVGLSMIRLLLPFVLILTTQDLLSREFDRRYFLNTFSYPHSRRRLLLGRFLASTTLTLGLLILLAGALALLAWTAEKDYAQASPVSLGLPYMITITFIGLDILLLSALATFIAVVASTPSLVLLGTVGFMLIARSFSTIIELLTRSSYVVEDPESYRSGLTLLGYLLPDLGALDVREIALYGKMQFLPADWGWLVVSTLAYVIGLLALATWALNRKRFS